MINAIQKLFPRQGSRPPKALLISHPHRISLHDEIDRLLIMNTVKPSPEIQR